MGTQMVVNYALLLLCITYLVLCPLFLGWVFPLIKRGSDRVRATLTGITALLTVIGLDTAFWAWIIVMTILKGEAQEQTTSYILTVTSFTTIRIASLLSALYIWRTLR